MQIEAFLLCDAAADYSGKLTIMGAFDSLHARSLPAVHPYCAIVVRIRYESQEAGEHRFGIFTIDEDGHAAGPTIETTVNLGIRPGRTSSVVNVILQMNNLTFLKYSEYGFDLTIDGENKARLPLSVEPLPAPSPTG